MSSTGIIDALDIEHPPAAHPSIIRNGRISLQLPYVIVE